MEVFIPKSYIYQKRNILFECIPINFDSTVHSQLKNQKICVQNRLFFIKKIYHKKKKKKKATQANRIGVAPFLQGET